MKNIELNSFVGGAELNTNKGERLINDDNIRLFPNPANTIVTLEYHLNENEQGKLQLYDMVGNEVKMIQLNYINNRVVFNINDLMMGLYIYKYTVNNNMVHTGKLLIE